MQNGARGGLAMARKIVVTSGKGGVGKTTVTANLGVQLAKNGCRVVVCDLDFGLNNVDVVLGVENLASFDVIDAIEGRCRPKQALVRHPRYPTLYSLASNRISERYVSPQAVRLILDTLAPQFDYILIDSPAGIDEGFHRAVACAEEALLVTTPHISAMRDADRVGNMLKGYRLSRIGLVVNMVRGDLVRRGGDRKGAQDPAHRHRARGGQDLFGKRCRPRAGVQAARELLHGQSAGGRGTEVHGALGRSHARTEKSLRREFMRSEVTKERLMGILHADKEEMNEVTREACIAEFSRVAGEYFETEGDVAMEIKRGRSSSEVSVTFRANRVKNFTIVK